MCKIRSLIEQIVRNYTGHTDKEKIDHQTQTVINDVAAYVNAIQTIRAHDHNLTRILDYWEKRFKDQKQAILTLLRASFSINADVADLLFSHDYGLNKILYFWHRKTENAKSGVKSKNTFIKTKIERTANNKALSLQQKLQYLDTIMNKSSDVIHLIIELLKQLAATEQNLSNNMIIALVENGKDGKLTDEELKITEKYAIELFLRFKDAEIKFPTVASDAKNFVNIVLQSESLPELYKQAFEVLSVDPNADNLESRIHAANMLAESIKFMIKTERMAFATYEVIWYLEKTRDLCEYMLEQTSDKETCINNIDASIKLLYSCIGDLFNKRLVNEDDLNLHSNIIHMLKEKPQNGFCKTYFDWVWDTVNFIYYGDVKLFQFALLHECLHEQIVTNTNFKLKTIYKPNSCNISDPLVALAIVLIQMSCKMMDDFHLASYAQVVQFILAQEGRQANAAMMIEFLFRTEFFVTKSLNYNLHARPRCLGYASDTDAEDISPKPLDDIDSSSVNNGQARKKLLL